MLISVATFILSVQLGAVDQCTPPDALITLDVSGTMKQKTTANGVEKTKFEWAKLGINAVMQAPGANGHTIEHELSLGLSVFPKPAKYVTVNGETTLKTGTGRCNMPGATESFVRVPFNIDNAMAIGAELTALGTPSGDNDTPIYQALLKAGEAATFPGDEALRQQAVILITDGIQDCCNGPDFNQIPDCVAKNVLDPVEADNNRTQIINLTALLKAQGIKVYAVGFGDKVDPQMLGGIAKAAGTERVSTCDPNAGSANTNSLCYYAVDAAGSQGLEIALRDIVHKIQTEECNGIDDDCDGHIDNGVPPKSCGGVDCGGVGTQTCTGGEGGTWSQCSVPLSQEVCDGHDNDCDGMMDAIPCETKCGPGWMRCYGGVMDTTCKPINGELTEICNNQDDNCDGQVDEGCDCENGGMEACTKNGTCAGVRTCMFGKWDVCEPKVAESDEVCDNVDNDCDGSIDNGTALCGPEGRCVNGRCVTGVGVEGGEPITESFVYRGQGLSRACSAGGAPELGMLLGLLMLLKRRKK